MSSTLRVPAQFFVLRHIHDKYACACCQSIQTAPMPAQIIDKGIPAPNCSRKWWSPSTTILCRCTGRRRSTRARACTLRARAAQWIGVCGLRLAPLAQALKEFILSHSVVHADETPVALLAPGKGMTKKAYVWVYRTTNFALQRAVFYDFCNDRSGEHPRRVLHEFTGRLVSDDHARYHAIHRRGVIAAFCRTHARRKLLEAHGDIGSVIPRTGRHAHRQAARNRTRGKHPSCAGAPTAAPAPLHHTVFNDARVTFAGRILSA